MSFYGRQTGAIGIRYKISDTYEANNLGEALHMLNTDYEVQRNLKVNGVSNNNEYKDRIQIPYKCRGMERK